MPAVSIVSNRVCLRGLAGAAVIVAMAAAIVGCGAAQSGAGAAGAIVRISERDFRITAPKHVPAGTVVLKVHNKGPDDHEFIVIRSRNGLLPLRTDGVTVDEERLSRSTAGVLEAGRPGSVRELRLKLRPGRYVLLCNMAGHYLGGMRTVLVVS